MRSKERISSALETGVEYLRSRQLSDGHWEDYQLPVGRSDAWVTAYVSLALSEAETRPPAQTAARAAARWLERNRAYPAGWGFNSTTGPDTDSTAFALLVIQRFRSVERRDVEFLLEHWREDGGFATYGGPGDWGISHPCVTPVAALALPPNLRSEKAPALAEYLARNRSRWGTWPAFWWRTCHYSTYWNLKLIRSLGGTIAAWRPRLPDDDNHRIHGAFDLAALIGIAVERGAEPLVIAKLAELLVSLQEEDGGWPGSEHLRVTRHDGGSTPVRAAELYGDTDRLLTTATVLQSLRAAESSCAA